MTKLYECMQHADHVILVYYISYLHLELPVVKVACFSFKALIIT